MFYLPKRCGLGDGLDEKDHMLPQKKIQWQYSTGIDSKSRFTGIYCWLSPIIDYSFIMCYIIRSGLIGIVVMISRWYFWSTL
ncbi:MAG: hypothetical protein DSY89_01070 [Deltaproteobacteria bacterium]|nr:MAG: hypothetical protein DSY89_01070 [Deltaproteobacteria bacterium]